MKNSNQEIDALTFKIIGCAMKVHSELGNGFQEVIYQRSLAIELTFADLSFEREKEMPIYYRDHQVGTRRVDFLVEDKISVELKAIIKLEDVHLHKVEKLVSFFDDVNKSYQKSDFD